MCDTLVATQAATKDGAVWFAKNSDREPGEAQLVEHLPRKTYPSPATLQCTHIEIPQAPATNEVVLSRPFWMWGAEMGANEHGVAIGNEAVFTKLAYEKTGLTGMDLLRLALERASSAREALDVITHLIARHGQGGACGYRNKKFRYHNSFISADTTEAWVLETAGAHWAAERVRGIRTISNALSIGSQFDLISPGAYSFAKEKGWCRSANDFDFARSFGNRFYSAMSGGAVRSACTFNFLNNKVGELEREDFFAALRDHAGLNPAAGWRMKMACAHASWQPTRQAGQTTGSMVSRLMPGSSMHWLTGTSSPCLSVFKPVTFGGELISTGPKPGAGFDSGSLFWRHEYLHRLALAYYENQKAIIDYDRLKLETKMTSGESSTSDKHAQSAWDEHRETIPEWIAQIESNKQRRAGNHFFSRYWIEQNRLDNLPSVFDSTSDQLSRSASR